ncbi:MAG: hypothetical protein ACOZBL_04990 [Patescibacteria group bacterium]
MVTMDHSIARLVALGKVDPNFAATKIKSPENFENLVQFYKTRILNAQQKENATKK